MSHRDGISLLRSDFNLIYKLSLARTGGARSSLRLRGGIVCRLARKNYLLSKPITMNPKPLSTGKIVGFVILGVLIILALWVMVSYNSLVSLNELAKTAQSDVEVQYQRRFDLIPNLVKSVEAVLQQERKVFKDLADARARYAGASSGSAEKIAAINGVESSLGRLLVVMENYPILKSSENVKQLQDQLEGTENRISVARSGYNSFVNELNTKINRFPSNIIARLFGFAERERFTAQEQAAKAPEVKFEIQ